MKKGGIWMDVIYELALDRKPICNDFDYQWIVIWGKNGGWLLGKIKTF